jgi:predicted patatin/cPLA2 family phospholipase
MEPQKPLSPQIAAPPPLAAEPHEVLRALAARARTGSQPGTRDDGLRIALAVEGGGMRGTISGGMALALHELGLVPAFDAVYGASAGAISGAWLLSSRPEGLRGWTVPAYAKTLIRRSALLRGRPVADVRALIEELYQTTFPMDFASVLANPVEYHPLATDAATGESTDLRPFVGSPAELRLALRASAALPLLAGPPVEFAGRRFYDAGVSESVPYRTALAQGATHILVLRSRRDPLTWPDGRLPSRSLRLITRTTMRRESPALRATFLARDARLAAADRQLADYELAAMPAAAPPDATEPFAPEPLAATPDAAEPFAPEPLAATPDAAEHVLAASDLAPAVFSIRPAAGSPQVSRLATDGKLLRAAFDAGEAATRAAFRTFDLSPLRITRLTPRDHEGFGTPGTRP